MQRTRFEYWKEWVDDAGRMWAELEVHDLPHDARKAHAGALTFLWVKAHVRPSVSDLYAVTTIKDEKTGLGRLVSSIRIADGARQADNLQLTT